MPGIALLVIVSAGTNAAEFEKIDVGRQGDTYRLQASAVIDANVRAVRDVLVDYGHMHWITGAILKSQALDEPEPGVTAVFIRSRACFGFFCKTIEQIQLADARDSGRITFVVLPEYSDLKQGGGEWLIDALPGDRTRITWKMFMEPDFWVPPLIGPGMIKSGLEEEGRDMIRGIEKLAREREQK